MFGSLRVRLPALFLLGVAVTGIVAALIALRLFQDYTSAQSYAELQREARGLALLYSQSALRAADEGESAPDFAAATLELATGDRLYYVGANVFPGQGSGLNRLPEGALEPEVVGADEPMTFEFTPPSENRVFLAASQPVRLEQGAPRSARSSWRSRGRRSATSGCHSCSGWLSPSSRES